ncbi:hypothetical protein G4B88_008369 [Cannabis sativa]|uniref:DUF4283 domain-containing protein n=1 Tax=Cannabis sativa TaxID=3483 RepID=A0A7J6G9X3_CANSA|nr:hypothetical protein G4B88_008369 [Cannabis sativa]
MASPSGVGSGGREDVFSFQIEEEDLAELPVGQEGEEEGIDDRWCLVGRFLSNRMIDFDKMQNILASLWQPGMGISYKNIGARWLRNRGWTPAASSGDNAPGHSSNQANMETNPPVGLATSHG